MTDVNIMKPVCEKVLKGDLSKIDWEGDLSELFTGIVRYFFFIQNESKEKSLNLLQATP
jgi:hypothetical protein